MFKKVNNEFLIPIEEFCALNSSNERMFFIKTIRPDIHKELLDCLDQASQLLITNGEYPEAFIENTRMDILSKNNLPGYIPVKMIKEYNKKRYCVCRDLLSNNKFIVPANILKSDFNSIYKYYLDLNPKSEIKIFLDMYAMELNCPRKVKKRLKTKDTK